jgi:hypothetical protein
MLELVLIAVAFVAVIVSLVHDPDGRESRPVSLESPSASRAPASVERARR